MATWNYKNLTEALLMKKTYDRHIQKQFNKSSVLFGRMKQKLNSFEGESKYIAIEQSIGGGRASGNLPTPNRNKTARAELTTKKLYATVSVDRESMKASRSSVGAFVKFTEYPVKVAVQGFNTNVERQMVLNDIAGLGTLFTVDATSVTGAGIPGSPYVIDVNEAHLLVSVEEGDLVNIDQETSELEVVEVDEDNSTISLVGTSATITTGTNATAPVFMQKSRGNELEGLQGILKATSGTYKGVAIGRRWKATQVARAASETHTELLNAAIMKVKKNTGAAPNLILAPYEQYVQILDSLESAKHYNLPARDKKFKASLAFSAIEYISPDGIVPIVLSRFVPPTEIYVLNDEHIEFHTRDSMEWFDEDGTVFLREATDSYEARYGAYADFFVNPFFQAIITNLPV